MQTIIQNQAAALVVTLRADGDPVAVATGSTVTAQLFDVATGAALFSPAKTLTSSDPGAVWASGVVGVSLLAADTSAAAPPDVMLVVAVDGKAYRFRVLVEVSGAAPTKSALFVKDFVVDEIRTDRLYAAAQSLGAGGKVTDEYIWSKVLAAESELQHTLRVRFQPTAFFSAQPSQAEIDALNGLPWEVDSGYDYDPEMFAGDRWGLFQTREIPIISISRVRYAYPAQASQPFDIPLEWVHLDRKYGQVRIVPISTSAQALLSPFMMQLLSANRLIPNMVQLSYVAGLANAARDYPELLDAIKKLAVLKVISDGFLPQSGSISADGLSQSISVDMSKYEETVDHIVNGAPGGNGGLMAAIHGIRMVVA